MTEEEPWPQRLFFFFYTVTFLTCSSKPRWAPATIFSPSAGISTSVSGVEGTLLSKTRRPPENAWAYLSLRGASGKTFSSLSVSEISPPFRPLSHFGLLLSCLTRK